MRNLWDNLLYWLSWRRRTRAALYAEINIALSDVDYAISVIYAMAEEMRILADNVERDRDYVYEVKEDITTLTHYRDLDLELQEIIGPIVER